MGIRAGVAAFSVVLIVYFSPAHAQDDDQFDGSIFHVVNTYSDDDLLALRTEPSLQAGLHKSLVPNGTLVEVVERRKDHWWYVRLLPLGQEGWILSGQGSRRWITCCRTGIGDPRPIALEEPVGFKTPTNVYCALEGTWIRCEVKRISGLPPLKPADCFLDWGDAYVLEPVGEKAFLLCHGDTVVNDALPMLPYGKTLSGGGYNCKSERLGLTCSNAVGHGFTLSRRSQTLF